MFTMHMYTLYITTYEIHIHDLLEFKPKISRKHPNAFAINYITFC